MFRALRVDRDDAGATSVTLETGLTDEDLMPGDVTVDVEFSSINFKDGLALTGRPGVIKPQRLIPGIDLVGTVASSASSEWLPGDRVLVNGWGIGETHDGGLSERARVSAEWLTAVPSTITNERAAAIGTAGFTAMLCVLAIQRHGVKEGEVLVTGASGGVGSIAIALLARAGYRVTASTGRAAEHDYLRSLGATEITDRATLSAPGKPLQGQRWAAVIDSVGSHTLANALAQTNYGGVVAACGLAQGADLPATVMPFILRGVTLAGINSVFCPTPQRLEAWNRLATDLDPALLDSLTSTIGLADAVDAAERIMAGTIRGRAVVAVTR
jgi:acrylyl-CoA reductase (NADPH)